VAGPSACSAPCAPRPHRLARSRMRATFAYGSLRPQSPATAMPHPSACIGLISPDVGTVGVLGLLAPYYLVEEEAARARPLWPASPAVVGVDARLVVDVWLATEGSLGLLQLVWTSAACQRIVPEPKRQGAGGGGWVERTMRARRVAGRFRDARWQLFERRACG